MLRILHFSDAHIDMVSMGKRDPETNLPVRVLDYLKALDCIVDAAIAEKVDLIIFAGDAYKDRTPAPTYQREWGRRVMRISQAGIPMVILVGNHDLSPAAGRAHALQEFDTLEVPHIHVIGKPCLLGPEDLEGLPVQIIGLPWVSRSGLVASLELNGLSPENVFSELEVRLAHLVNLFIERAYPDLPLILTAHASVQGAKYGEERGVMLGGDLVLSGAMVRDPRLDYVALGHIHKPQNLNESSHPPVVYSGSIERMNFGEVKDTKCYVIAEVEHGKTRLTWHKIPGRKFIDRYVLLDSIDDIQPKLQNALPDEADLEGAIVRLIIEYPRDWEAQIDESSLRRKAAGAFEFHLIRRPQMEGRIRLPSDKTLASLAPLELLDTYWKAAHTDEGEAILLQTLAQQVVGSDSRLTSREDGGEEA